MAQSISVRSKPQEYIFLEQYFSTGSFSVSDWWQRVGDGFNWACSGVYGPIDNNMRGLMWDELVGIQ